MPLRSGRLTPMELSFVKAESQTNNPLFAAWQAGFKFPSVAASKLMHNPEIKHAIRQETQRFLFEEAGALAVGVLAEIAVDKKQPVGARVKSATELAKLSNIGISDEIAGKPDHELTAVELDDMRRKLEAQRHAVQSVLDSIPKHAIDGVSVLD